MSTDKKIEEAIKPLVEMYSNIETELLKDIARHFSINDEFINADYWRIKKLEEMGAFNKHTLEYLSKQTGASQRKLRQCLKKIGIMTVDSPELSKLYKNGTIKVNPEVLLENYTIQTMINTAYNELNNRFIQLSPQIEKASREAYLKVLEQTYLDVTMGTHSYDQAIRKAINDLSNEGLTTMTYQITDDAGNVVGTRNYDIEGIVRRDVLTGTRQLSGEMNIELIKETGCKYVKFSEHLDCRITHFDWQGTIVPSDKWEDIAEYGDVAGIYGINCRHYVEPYFGEHRGKEEKEYTKQQCDDAYKLSQRQRYLERGLRSWKRKQEMYRANGDTYAMKKSAIKVNEWQKRLNEFTDNRKYDREYVYGYKPIKVNDIPPKSVVDKLNEVNIKADDSLGKIPTNLLKRNTNQYVKLSKKYHIEEFLKNQNATYYSPDTKKFIGAIGYNDKMTNISINSSYKYFYDKSSLENLIEEQSKINYFMPCDPKNYDIYAMTHEFGHNLQIKMFKDKYPNGNVNKYSYYANKVKYDIIEIAKKRNPNTDIGNQISVYGHDIKAQEFFAEAFANMELGKPNAIGNAMKEYLKREGIIK